MDASKSGDVHAIVSVQCSSGTKRDLSGTAPEQVSGMAALYMTCRSCVQCFDVLWTFVTCSGYV